MKVVKLIIVAFLLMEFSIPCNAQNMVPETLWKLGRVSDPQLSPDGKVIVYNIRSYSLQANKGHSDIYRINVDGSGKMLLAGDSVNYTSPRWSKDGNKVFFLCNKSGSNQIWIMNSDGSNKAQASNYGSDISNYSISPNEGKVWFTADVKLDKSVADIYPDLPKATGRIIDNLMYRHWDTW